MQELYARKGQIVTNMEILQNQLNVVNQAIQDQLNKPAPEPVVEEETEVDED